MFKLEAHKIFEMESLDALFEFATEGIIITNSQGKIIKANPSSERLFGYSKGELLDKSIEDLVPKRYKAKHADYRDGYHQSPNPRAMGKNIDLRAKRKDDTEFPVEISLTHYKKEDEAFVIAFIIDITERKKHEEDIIKLNHDLEKKVSERTKVLEEALIELENSKAQLSEALASEKELNDMKSRFVTMASHEFRTPLSTILSSISLVGKYTLSEEDEKRQKHVLRVKSAVTNMTLILNDFLSAEKLEEGKVIVRQEEVFLSPIVNEVLTEMNGILKPGQKVAYNHTGKNDALLDKQMVRNILLNLISNAIKFSAENKTIKIKTDISNQETTIEVSDEGIGIPKEEQLHLFERFFRAKNVTNIQGTGLGLNIVGKYLEAMRGKIDFKSELNKGTTFIITIPNEE
ncbi:MAG: PAS domain-containing sensor histidine kinase [Bacteroidia bacterium]